MVNFRKTDLFFMLAVGLLAGLYVALRPDLSAASVLFWTLAALSLPWALSRTLTARLIFFFCLLAFVDFLKRLVFLLDGLVNWSQYAIYLFPYLYYFSVVLLPWGWTRLRRGISHNQL
jgi:hypothetical protein